MERVAFLLKIKQGTQEEYIKRHQAVYPELLQAFQEVGIETYSIFLHEEQLFAYMEVEDYQRAMDELSQNEANKQWQSFMSDLLVAHHEGSTVKVIPEVFHFSHSHQRGDSK